MDCNLGYFFCGSRRPRAARVLSKWASSPYLWRVTSAFIFWNVSVEYVSQAASPSGELITSTGLISAYQRDKPYKNIYNLTIVDTSFNNQQFMSFNNRLEKQVFRIQSPMNWQRHRNLHHLKRIQQMTKQLRWYLPQ